MTTHRLLLPALLAVIGLTRFASAAEQPNILFIFADDQCYDTINALGNQEVETPNLDRLVRRGVTFTRTYNQGSWSGAVCIASRMMLNSGRFVWHAQKDYSAADKLYREQGRMWAQLLEKAGYETYMSGKWHLRANAEKTFNHASHVRPGMPNQTPAGYNRPHEGKEDQWSPYDKSFEGFWKGGKHWSEVLGDDSEAFLASAAQSKKPFFMYLAFNAPHDPRQAPKEYVDKYPLDKIAIPESFLPEYPFNEAMKSGRKLRDERLAPFPRTKYSVQVNRQEYYAIITHMDAQIGRILDALEKTGKADNTYIFFTADHGLAVGQHGLMGKQNMFDHSVRVPFMVVGPQVPQNKKIAAPIYLQDVMPTTLALAGAEKPDYVQFQNLLPLIHGETQKSAYNAIYGAYLGGQRMVTMDGYKMTLYPTAKKVLLFDLDNDPQELRDLSEQKDQQGRLKKLFAKLLELQRETGDSMDLKKTYPGLL